MPWPESPVPPPPVVREGLKREIISLRKLSDKEIQGGRVVCIVRVKYCWWIRTPMGHEESVIV